MKRAKFIAPARREFLKEVSYYNEQESGLGVAFAQKIEEATARVLEFPETGRQPRRIPSGFPFKNSHFLLFIGQIVKALSSLPLLTMRVALIIGRHVHKLPGLGPMLSSYYE